MFFVSLTSIYISYQWLACHCWTSGYFVSNLLRGERENHQRGKEYNIIMLLRSNSIDLPGQQSLVTKRLLFLVDDYCWVSEILSFSLVRNAVWWSVWDCCESAVVKAVLLMSCCHPGLQEAAWSSLSPAWLLNSLICQHRSLNTQH